MHPTGVAHDLLSLLDVSALHRQLTNESRPAMFDQVQRFDVAAGATDGAGQTTKRAWHVLDLGTDANRIASRRVQLQHASQAAIFRAPA